MNPSDRKMKQYRANRSWSITAKIDLAQKLLDDAVSAGANDFSDPEWKLSDPDAAEGKAYAVALEKAHDIAEQIGKVLRGKSWNTAVCN